LVAKIHGVLHSFASQRRSAMTHRRAMFGRVGKRGVLRTAEANGITLVGIARGQYFETFSHPTGIIF
jgi:hypothetical protein